MKRPYVRSDLQESNSLHYFQSYAIAERIEFFYLSNESPLASNFGCHAQVLLALPSLEDEDIMKEFQNSDIIFSVIEIVFFITYWWYLSHDPYI